MINIELEDRLYTSTEVANVLGVSLRSVYRYLEDGKLIAEMKTATGRHRFTKQNILDFLSPQTKKKAPAPAEVKKEEAAPTAPAEPTSPAEPAEPVTQEATPTEDSKEEVDWLSKFRGAAEKYKAEAAQEAAPKTESVSDLASVEAAPSANRYYKTGEGGLKDLAQNLDKSAKKASLNYAFTLDAGLSLHKPIKPFSLLHSYVKSEDLVFFEKILSLSEAVESDAQLCLIVSDDGSLYSEKKEIHGLNVVSDERLKEDLISSGKEELAKEL